MANGAAASERYVLALDLGTTALKVALATTRGRLIDTETEPQQVTLLPGGGAEQDPADWRRSVVLASSRLLERNEGARSRIAAVNASAQWSGTVAVGDEDGAIRPAISWMDSRGASQAQRITDGLVKVQDYGVRRMLLWGRRTGGGPTRSGKDSEAHILWLKDQERGSYERTRVFLEPKDWLNLRLTGRAVTSYDAPRHGPGRPRRGCLQLALAPPVRRAVREAPVRRRDPHHRRGRDQRVAPHRAAAAGRRAHLRHRPPGPAGCARTLRAGSPGVRRAHESDAGREGRMAPVYGMADAMPFRGIVGDMLR